MLSVICYDSSVTVFLSLQLARSRYRHSSKTSPASLNALVSLVNEGIFFAKKQLSKGTAAFANLRTARIDVVANTRSTVSQDSSLPTLDDPPLNSTSNDREGMSILSTPLPSSSVHGDRQPCHVPFVNEPNEENWNVDESESDDDPEASDDIVVQLVEQDLPQEIIWRDYYWPKGLVSSSRDCDVILYRREFSQGLIEGRNGSNACSFIAVIFAYLFDTYKLDFPYGKSYNDSRAESAMRSAMIQGNRLYDRHRSSLPNRYCSVQEVSDALMDYCLLIIVEEKPLWLESPEYFATIKGQCDLMMSFKMRFCAIFTFSDGKTSMLLGDGFYIAFLDTHCYHYFNLDGGAVFVHGAKDLDRFVERIADVNAWPTNIYGNLTFVKFS